MVVRGQARFGGEGQDLVRYGGAWRGLAGQGFYSVSDLTASSNVLAVFVLARILPKCR